MQCWDLYWVALTLQLACSREGLESHAGKANDDEDRPRLQPPTHIRNKHNSESSALRTTSALGGLQIS